MTPAEMAALHKAAFTQSRPWSAEEFASLLGTPGAFAIGDTRTFALVRITLDEAELLTFATHPGHQRQGHARRLMTDWQDEAARRGAARAFLEVAEDNVPALGLYLSGGYSVAGRRRGYYPRPGHTPADALVLTREI
ncbi:MAG: GNAT family N-acetyltransferase [Marinibacterium sp.]